MWLRGKLLVCSTRNRGWRGVSESVVCTTHRSGPWEKEMSSPLSITPLRLIGGRSGKSGRVLHPSPSPPTGTKEKLQPNSALVEGPHPEQCYCICWVREFVGWESCRNETQVGVDPGSLTLHMRAAKKAGLGQRVGGLRVEERFGNGYTRTVASRPP